MPGTTFGIIMIVIAGIAGLVIMEVLVLAAADRPYFKHPHPDQMQSNVRGGVHLGDPRSGAPHDEPVRVSRTPGEPGGPDGRAGSGTDQPVAAASSAGPDRREPGKGPVTAHENAIEPGRHRHLRASPAEPPAGSRRAARRLGLSP